MQVFGKEIRSHHTAEGITRIKCRMHNMSQMYTPMYEGNLVHKVDGLTSNQA